MNLSNVPMIIALDELYKCIPLNKGVFLTMYSFSDICMKLWDENSDSCKEDYETNIYYNDMLCFSSQILLSYVTYKRKLHTGM